MRSLRLVLLWLLAVALPVQGWATTAMLACGPGHAAMQLHTADAAHDAAAHHGHDDAVDDLQQHAQHTCSACAACGVVHVLPPSVVAFDAPHEPAGYDAPPRAAGASFHTSAPERPPRPHLA